jgi:hypothetical protein
MPFYFSASLSLIISSLCPNPFCHSAILSPSTASIDPRFVSGGMIRVDSTAVFHLRVDSSFAVSLSLSLSVSLSTLPLFISLHFHEHFPLLISISRRLPNPSPSPSRSRSPSPSPSIHRDPEFVCFSFFTSSSFISSSFP